MLVEVIRVVAGSLKGGLRGLAFSRSHRETAELNLSG